MLDYFHQERRKWQGRTAALGHVFLFYICQKMYSILLGFRVDERA